MSKELLTSVSARIRRLIDKYPMLDHEGERAMIAKYLRDRKTLRDKLVLHNLRLAVSMAGRYYEPSESADDMLMRAIRGLIVAANRFDPGNGAPFADYAYRAVQSSYRDLFSPILSAPKTQLNTSACLDAPAIKRASASGSEATPTACDAIVSRGSAPEWTPINPHRTTEDDDFRKEDVSALASLLINRYVGGASQRNREMLHARMMGASLLGLAKKYGVTKQAVDFSVRPLLDAIASGLRAEPKGSELHGVLIPNESRILADSVDADSVSAFLDEHGLELDDSGDCLTEEERAAAVMDEYDLAEADARVAARRPDGGPDFDAMRRAYELCVAWRMKPADAAVRMARPETFVRFLRHKASEIVRCRRHGKPMPSVKMSHDVKDALYNVGVPWGRFQTVSYSGLMQPHDSRSSGRTNRNYLLTTFVPYRGCFYSQMSYKTFSAQKSGPQPRKRKSRRCMSLRELRMLVRMGAIPVVAARRLSGDAPGLPARRT